MERYVSKGQALFIALSFIIATGVGIAILIILSANAYIAKRKALFTPDSTQLGQELAINIDSNIIKSDSIKKTRDKESVLRETMDNYFDIKKVIIVIDKGFSVKKHINEDGYEEVAPEIDEIDEVYDGTTKNVELYLLTCKKNLTISEVKKLFKNLNVSVIETNLIELLALKKQYLGTEIRKNVVAGFNQKLKGYPYLTPSKINTKFSLLFKQDIDLQNFDVLVKVK